MVRVTQSVKALTQGGPAESDYKDLEEFPVCSDTQRKSQVDRWCEVTKCLRVIFKHVRSFCVQRCLRKAIVYQ